MTDEVKVKVVGSSPEKPWGPFGQFFHKDGMKNSISQKALNTCLVFFLIFMTISTVISSCNEETRQKFDLLLQMPDVQKATNEVAAPPIYDNNREASYSRQQKGSIQPKPVEKIKVVSLSQINSIPTGVEVPCALVSGATNGPVKAKLTENLSVDGEVIFEKGSIIFGTGKSTEERLFVNFKKLITKDGKEIKIKAQAYDQSDKIIGLKGSKISNRAWKMAGATGLSFIAGYTEALKTPEIPIFGSTKAPSPRDAALSGAANAAMEQSKEMIESMKNAPVIIEVSAKTPITVIFEGDLKDEEQQ
ncbi:MAG: TrbI/VirB10 family protein [Bdellovibrionaceae bacterium]|nr:TrbI/VirB10 family protein [Pseudobdellovibrionaceae bacterium]